MRRFLLAMLMLGFARDAYADLSVEYRGKMSVMMMGSADMRMRLEIRRDRSRTVRLASDPSNPAATDSMIEITREDRHLHWQLYPKDHTYAEFVWPDTTWPVGNPLPDSKPQVTSGIPDSIQRRMDAMKDQVTEVRRTGETTTINGFRAEHFVIESRMRDRSALPSGNDFGSINDLWITRDVPDLSEAETLLAVASRHQTLTAPGMPGAGRGLGVFSNQPDSLRGLAVRIVSRLRMLDSTGVADYAKKMAGVSEKASEAESGIDFDPATGTMPLMNLEMTSLSMKPIADSEFELPAGYHRVEWQSDVPPSPKPRMQKSSSPRRHR